MVSEPTDWIRLDSDRLHAAINPAGAQLSVLRDERGRDLLWDGDPAFWTGRAPILFPIVGALNGNAFTWRGRSYQMAKHGFARRRRFDVISSGPSSARFRLTADDETRAEYPFESELDVEFTATAHQLTVKASARNLGADAMPASLGFHPAFRWPLPDSSSRETHVLDFDHDEPADIRRLNSAGLLAPEPRPTPVRGSRLVLDDALFAPDVIIFQHVTSRRVRYHGEHGPALRVSFPDATWLGVWTRPGAGFVCIEPWRGVADPEGFAGEFASKLGVEQVEPGGELTLTMTIEVEA